MWAGKAPAADAVSASTAVLQTEEAVFALPTIPALVASARAPAPEQIDDRQQNDGADQ